MIFVTAFTSRQSVWLAPRQYLPLPYVPSIHFAIRASSACSLGSAGAGSGMAASLRRVSLRRRSSGRASASKRVAALASSMVAAIVSWFASAEIRSVSSVM